MSHTKDSFTYHGCGIAADRKQTRVDKAIYNRHKYAKKRMATRISYAVTYSCLKVLVVTLVVFVGRVVSRAVQHEV
jgi:hypothetical protein